MPIALPKEKREIETQRDRKGEREREQVFATDVT